MGDTHSISSGSMEVTWSWKTRGEPRMPESLRQGELLAATRKSERMVSPLLFEYKNRLHCVGWQCIDVMTSVRLSILEGFRSKMSIRQAKQQEGLKLWLLTSKFHRLIRRSSEDKNTSPSEKQDRELMLKQCAWPYTRLF